MPGDSEHGSRPSVAIVRAFRRYKEWAVLCVRKLRDALMGIFFFVVGLEIKREFLAGALASVRKAMLPIAGAVAGLALVAFSSAGTPGQKS